MGIKSHVSQDKGETTTKNEYYVIETNDHRVKAWLELQQPQSYRSQKPEKTNNINKEMVKPGAY